MSNVELRNIIFFIFFIAEAKRLPQFVIRHSTFDIPEGTA